MIKPHLKTQEGVQSAALDICDIVDKFLKTYYDISPIDNEVNDILYDNILVYMDAIAGSPDYGNYN